MSKDISQWAHSMETFIFDCDGVLWIGSTLLPLVKETLDKLHSLGKKTLFVTNNSTKCRKEYVKKFKSLGLQVEEDNIFGSSYAAAYYLANTLSFPSDKKVYVIGMQGICQELQNLGINYTGSHEDNENLKDMSDMGSILPDPSIGAVLLGFDLNINYKKLAKAYTYVQSNPECLFLATNDDLTIPAGDRVYPGTGALLSSLIAPLERKPVVLGKPHQTMLDVVIDKHHLNRSKTCMVGDRLDTDILFGQQGQLNTLLVLSGVTSKQASETSDIQADIVLESLGHLLDYL